MFPSSRPPPRRTLLAGAALTVLCIAYVAAVLTRFTLHYTTNDNTGIISFITEGDAVPYVGMLLSGLLHGAYVLSPRIAWFGVALYAFLTLSLVTWVLLVWSVFRNKIVAIVLLLAVFGYYLGLLTSLDFTATASMLCFTGLCWACVQLLDGDGGAPWRLLGPGLLFMCGMLVRPEVALGALAYAAPLGLIVCLRQLRSRPLPSALRPLGAAALLFFTPAVLNLAVDGAWRHAARTPVEASYEAFNRAGGKLYHLSRARRKMLGREHAVIASLHWSPADYNRLVHWKFLDERVYTPDSIDRLVASAPPPDLSAASLKPLVADRLPPRNWMFLMLLAGAPIFLLLLPRRPAEGLPGLALPVYAFVLTAYMCLLYAYPYRVEMPLELGLGLAALLVAALLARQADFGKLPLQAAAWVAVTLVLAGAVVSMGQVLKSQKHDAMQALRTAKTLRTLNTRFAGDVILIQPRGRALNTLSPLKPIMFRFQPINLGWNTFSPRFYRQISAVGAAHGYELVDRLIDNPKGYVYGSADWCRKMLAYASDRAHRDLRPVKVAQGMYQLREFRH